MYRLDRRRRFGRFTSHSNGCLGLARRVSPSPNTWVVAPFVHQLPNVQGGTTDTVKITAPASRCFTIFGCWLVLLEGQNECIAGSQGAHPLSGTPRSLRSEELPEQSDTAEEMRSVAASTENEHRDGRTRGGAHSLSWTASYPVHLATRSWTAISRSPLKSVGPFCDRPWHQTFLMNDERVTETIERVRP